MKMKCVEFLIVLNEALFMFSMQGVSIMSETDVGYELTMKFGNPVYMDIPIWMLLSSAFLSLFFGYLSDSLVGKCYIILFGLICAFGSSITLLLLHFWDSKIMLMIIKILKLVYTSTSGVRNASIFEQIFILRKFKKSRTWISVIIMARIVVYSVHHILNNFRLKEYLIYFHFLNAIFILIYIISFIVFIQKMYVESIFIFIWERCFMCVVISWWRWIRKVMKIEKKLSYERPRSVLRKSDSSGQKSRRKVKFEPKVKIRLHGSPSVSSEEDARSCWGFRQMKKPVQDPPRNDQTETLKGIEAESSLFSRIFSKKDLTKKASSEQIQDRRIIIRYWLDHSKPHCSDFTIFQMKKFIFTFPLILQPFIFTLFIFVVLSMTEYHKKMTIRSSFLTQTLCEFNFYFDAVLILIFEWLIRPLSPKNLRSWHFVLMGYFFLLLATIATLGIQMKLESNLEYMPFPMYAQLRMYNSLEAISKVETSWDRTTYFIAPHHNVLITKIPVNGNQTLKVNNGIKEIEKSFSLGSLKTKSYVLKRDLIKESIREDPSFFVDVEDSSKSYIFLVDSGEYFNLILKGKNNFTYVLESDFSGRALDVTPQIYNVSLTTFPGILNNVGFIEIKSSTLYTYFVSLNNTRGHAILSVVEGPLDVDYYLLLIPMFLLSLSNVVASGYYYTTVFLNAPEKLRATVFSFAVSMNLLATSLFVFYVPGSASVYKILILQTVVIAFSAFGHTIVSPKFETYE